LDVISPQKLRKRLAKGMGESQNVSGGLCRLSMIKKWYREMTARNERVAMLRGQKLDAVVPQLTEIDLQIR
jgi:hypothetical protein